MLDSPEVRRAVLDHLIEERVLYSSALKSGMTVANAELQSVIGDIPVFKIAAEIHRSVTEICSALRDERRRRRPVCARPHRR
jgi:hypothetical protein